MKKNFLILLLLILNVFFLLRNREFLIGSLNAHAKTEGILKNTERTDYLKWKIFTGNLDADSGTTIPTGLSSYTILAVYPSVSFGDGDFASGNFGDAGVSGQDFEVSFDSSNGEVTVSSVDSNYYGRNYRLLVFYK